MLTSPTLRRPPRRTTAPAAVVLALSLGLAACGDDEPDQKSDDGPDSPAVASVETGDCLDADDRNNADTDSEVFSTDYVVDCDDDHQFEVLAVVDLPEDYADAFATDADRDDLDDAWGDRDADDLTEVNEWARLTCFDELAAATGLNEIEVDGLTGGDDFVVMPGSSGVTSKAVYPTESWEDWPRVVCAARYSELTDGDPTEADTVDVEGGFRISDYLTADFPEYFRQCGNTDNSDNDIPGECDEPHYREFLFLVDVTELIDDDVMNDLLLAEESDTDDIWPMDDSWDVLDGICTAGMRVAIGEDFDQRSLAPFPSMEGDWHDDSPQHWVLCSTRPVQSALYDLPAGSVFGIGDEKVDRVPYEQ